MIAPSTDVTDPAKGEVDLHLDLDGVDLYLQDALQGLGRLPDESMDLAIADPPYGAASEATWSLPTGHLLPGFGGAWALDSQEWDRFAAADGFQFAVKWLSELRRVVKPSGSIWIHATYHNSGYVNVACQILGLEIINEVVWFKRNAFPNLARRRLTASHETLLWVHTGGRRRQYRFNYLDAKLASFHGDALKTPDRQMRTVWDIPNNKTRDELRFGRHPTQKPLRLTERLFTIAGLKGGTAVVPFVGSGTEIVAAMRYGMGAIGYETDADYFRLASARITAEADRTQTLWS